MEERERLAASRCSTSTSTGTSSVGLWGLSSMDDCRDRESWDDEAGLAEFAILCEGGEGCWSSSFQAIDDSGRWKEVKRLQPLHFVAALLKRVDEADIGNVSANSVSFGQSPH